MPHRILLAALIASQDPRTAAQDRERQRAESIYLVRISVPLYQSITKAKLAEDWPRLVVLYDTLLQYEPRRAVAFFERGMAKFRLRDTAGARTDLVQARVLGYKRAAQHLTRDGELTLKLQSADSAAADTQRPLTPQEDSAIKAERWRALGQKAPRQPWTWRRVLATDWAISLVMIVIIVVGLLINRRVYRR